MKRRGLGTRRDWPEEGQRIQIIGDHPHTGRYGRVVGFGVIHLFPEQGTKPKIALEGAVDREAEKQCFLLSQDQWEPA